MPEGDTFHHAARCVGATLVNREIASIETPQPRHELDRWPERLRDLACERLTPAASTCSWRFEGEPTLHSHLRMGGKWGGYRGASAGGAHCTAPGC